MTYCPLPGKPSLVLEYFRHLAEQKGKIHFWRDMNSDSKG